MSNDTIIQETRRWIRSIVIGLNLCPFAARVFQGERIRYVVTDACNRKSLLAALTTELNTLHDAPITEIETTLLIHPGAMTDFLDYNDFLGDADQLLEELSLDSIIQIASFHPQYLFAGVNADAAEHFTNRAPCPMLHLLREESLTQVTGDIDQMDEIPRRNIKTMRDLGSVKLRAMLKAIAKPEV